MKHHESEKDFEDVQNRTLDLNVFRKDSMRKVFDTLHGIPNEIEIPTAVEIISFCFYKNKIKEGSKFEKSLYKQLIRQIKEDEALSRRTLTLSWMYFKAMGDYTEV